MSAQDFIINGVRSLKQGATTRQNIVEHYMARYGGNFGEVVLTLEIAIGDYNEGIWR